MECKDITVIIIMKEFYSHGKHTLIHTENLLKKTNSPYKNDPCHNSSMIIVKVSNFVVI